MFGYYGYVPDERQAKTRQERDILWAARMKWYYCDDVAADTLASLAEEFRSDEHPRKKYGKAYKSKKEARKAMEAATATSGGKASASSD